MVDETDNESTDSLIKSEIHPSTEGHRSKRRIQWTQILMSAIVGILPAFLTWLVMSSHGSHTGTRLMRTPIPDCR